MSNMNDSDGIKACKALLRRVHLDHLKKQAWKEEGSVPYMEKRYPTTLLEQIRCHDPSGEWFGYTFEPVTLMAINEAAYKVALLPRNLHTLFNEDFGFAQYIYLLLTTPSAFKYWKKYDDCPNLVEGWCAFKFEFMDLVMGHTGVVKIENLYRELGDIGGSLYDPTEKGRCLLDVGVTHDQLNHVTTDLAKHLTLVCSRSEGVLTAVRLFVGDPVHLRDISLPWSDERCNARSMSLTQARRLGYEYVQLSKDGVWQSEIRKDPSF